MRSKVVTSVKILTKGVLYKVKQRVLLFCVTFPVRQTGVYLSLGLPLCYVELRLHPCYFKRKGDCRHIGGGEKALMVTSICTSLVRIGLP